MHSLGNLNAYSGQSVTYTDQTLGPNQVLANRYQINGLIDSTSSVIENLEDICSTAGSWLSYDIHAGKWGVVINKAESSVASFDDSNILGDIVVSGTGLTDLYNSVRVELPNRDIRDSSDFVSIEIPDIDRNANEPDNVLNLSYEALNEPIQAEILGFIELKQSRVDKVITFGVDYSYIGLNAGDVISVTNAQFDFVSKLFRIITISEIQDGTGPLYLEITALEYDPGVYDESNLYRYTRSNNTGIITIGSIGQPGTPVVTKYEVDARPRLEIATTSPTGIVGGIEFWLTTDTTEPVDDNRSYVLIGIEKPSGGGTFSSGTTVTLDYQNLQAGNVYVKTRGFNATTVGPFSDVSGLVEFTPTQVTDAINPNTEVLNSSGGLLTVLALTELIKRLDDLWGPIGNAIGNNTIFSTIFDLFQQDTGYDLVGQTKSGNLVVAANVNILNEGNVISTAANSLNFVGNGVNATNSSNDITITINSPSQEEVETIAKSAAVDYALTSQHDVLLKSIAQRTVGNVIQNTTSQFNFIFGSSPYMGAYDSRYGIMTCGSLTYGSGSVQSEAALPTESGNVTFKINFSGTAVGTLTTDIYGDQSVSLPTFRLYNATRSFTITDLYSRSAFASANAANAINRVVNTYYQSNPLPANTASATIGNVLYLASDLALCQISSVANSNPNWSQNLGELNGGLNFYYALCTSYSSGNAISEQNWGDWTRVANQLDLKTNYPDRDRPTANSFCTVNNRRRSLSGSGKVEDLCGLDIYEPPAVTSEVSSTLNQASYIVYDDHSATVTINVPDNSMIIFGISGHDLGNTVAFAANTIFVGNTIQFPGYTPVSGQTANIQIWDIDGFRESLNPAGAFDLNSSNGTSQWTKVSVWPTLGNVWPDPPNATWPTTAGLSDKLINWHANTTNNLNDTYLQPTANGVVNSQVSGQSGPLQGFMLAASPATNCPVFYVDKL